MKYKAHTLAQTNIREKGNSVIYKLHSSAFKPFDSYHTINIGQRVLTEAYH